MTRYRGGKGGRARSKRAGPQRHGGNLGRNTGQRARQRNDRAQGPAPADEPTVRAPIRDTGRAHAEAPNPERPKQHTLSDWLPPAPTPRDRRDVAAGPTSTQDERFAANAALNPPRDLWAALAAQPGCPPEFRAAWLLGSQAPIIAAHCAVTGDDPDDIHRRAAEKILAEGGGGSKS